MAGLLALVAVGCTGNPELGTAALRRDTLDALAANVALPAIGTARDEAEALSFATGDLASTPGKTTTRAARDAWRRAHVAFRELDGLRFGPYEKRKLAAAIDYRPSSDQRVEETIDGRLGYDPAFVAGLGSGTKGFFALEYLLFGDDEDTAYEALTDPGTGASRREFARALGAAIFVALAELDTAWDSAAENYAANLTEAGRVQIGFRTTKVAVDELVNGLATGTEELLDARLGKPLGKTKFGAGTPRPEEAESVRSGNSLADMRASLSGLEAIYVGAYGAKGGRGIGDLVHDANPVLDAELRSDFAAAKRAIDAIDEPFPRAIEADAEDVEAAHRAVRALRERIVLGLVPALGVTLQFNQGDGD